jgi:hypothetical protein
LYDRVAACFAISVIPDKAFGFRKRQLAVQLVPGGNQGISRVVIAGAVFLENREKLLFGVIDTPIAHSSLALAFNKLKQRICTRRVFVAEHFTGFLRHSPSTPQNLLH